VLTPWKIPPFVVSIHGEIPNDGLSTFAGALAACTTVAVYDAAVVGVATADHGVSPKIAVAKKAPFASACVEPPPLPVANDGVAPVAVQALVVQYAAPAGVDIVSAPPAPAQVTADGQKPYPKNPIRFCCGTGLVVERVVGEPGL